MTSNRNIARYVCSPFSTGRSSPCARTSFVSSVSSYGQVRRRRYRRRQSNGGMLSRFSLIEQSRKCPLCSRSFDNSYLIHRIRSQYDYQKHYLPPPRSSSIPPLTSESRTNALRNARRERQWGRRQRQQREEADQLERAIARRRWIYQHHLYAKVVLSAHSLSQSVC